MQNMKHDLRITDWCGVEGCEVVQVFPTGCFKGKVLPDIILYYVLRALSQ